MTSESSALPSLVISVSIAVSIAVINSFLLVSILASAPLTKPSITKSIVPCLVLAPLPSSNHLYFLLMFELLLLDIVVQIIRLIKKVV